MGKALIILVLIFCANCSMAFAENDYAPGRIIIKTVPDAIKMPPNTSSISAEKSEQIMPRSLHEKTKKYKVKKIKKLFGEQKIKPGSRSVGKQIIQVPDLSNYYLVEAANDVDIRAMIEEYKADPNVEYAEPDYAVKLNAIPNDPYFRTHSKEPNQWGLYKICAPAAWDITAGSSTVIVAVVDTGVNYNHEDLAGKVILGPDYGDNDNDPMDVHGHGTHVAGIISAQTNNKTGIAGVSWNSKILAIKMFDSSGRGYTSGSIAGLQYAADHGARAINMSYGSSYYCPPEQDAVNYAYAAGCVLIAAAGNENTSAPRYPAAYEHVIAVAATNLFDGPARGMVRDINGKPSMVQYTNYGPWVDIAAPGGENYYNEKENIYGDFSYEILSCGLSQNGYAYKNGTSMAAPFVSGAAALVLSVLPGASPDEVEEILKSGVDKISDSRLGAGRLNIGRSLFREIPPTPGNMPIISDFAFDKYENKYVVYCSEGRVVKYNKYGAEIATVNSFGGTLFSFPHGIALSPDGERVYVTDTYNNRVIILNSSLQGIRQISGSDVFSAFECRTVYEVFLWNVQKSEEDWSEHKTPGERYEYPKGISVDNRGYVYVADLLKGRILKYDRNGNPARFDNLLSSGGYDVGRTYLGNLFGLTTFLSGWFGGGDCQIWISGHKVVKDWYSNAITGSFDNQPSMLASVFVKDNIYVTDMSKQKIRQFDSNGVYMTSSDISLYVPVYSFVSGCTTIDAGSIYIADKGAHRIQRCSMDYKYVCTYGNQKYSPSPLKVMIKQEGDKNKLYFCDGTMKNIQSYDADKPPADFILLTATKEVYFINEKGMDISWAATHEGEFIKLRGYQIVAKRSDRDHWEIIVDNISPEVRSAHFSLPSEGLWRINVRAFNGTAFRDSDGYSRLGEASQLTYDVSGETREESKHILAICDLTPPTVYDVFLPAQYSPMVGSFEAAFKISDKTTNELTSIKAVIYNKDDELVKQLISKTPSICGNHNIVWWGKDYDDGIVKDGEYQLLVSAVDKSGNNRDEYKSFIVDTIFPEISNIWLSSDLLTPNDDGVNDTLNISFLISETADASVQFKDENGKIIRNIDLLTDKDVLNSISWDGKNNAGEFVSGTIEAVIIATDPAGNKAESALKAKIFAESGDYLLWVNVNPNAISQVSKELKPITFTYNTNDTCTVEAYITYQGENIFTLLTPTPLDRGKNTVTWDGKDDSGSNVKEGAYNYVFLALTPNRSMARKGIVRVDNTPPYVSKISLVPSIESVQMIQNRTEDISLSYYLSENSSVSIDIIDMNGFAISNLVSGQLQEARSNTILFNKDKLERSGIYEPGDYRIRIQLADEAGNEYISDTTKLSIVSDFNVSNVSAYPSVITPNNDNHDDYLTIKYKVIGGGGDVLCASKIKSTSGATIKTYKYTGSGSSISNYEIWDGKDESGNPVPDGEYQYEITAKNSDGTETPPYIGDITLVKDPTISIYMEPLEFSPNGDDFQDISKIFYKIDYQGKLIEGNSNIETNIYDASGNKVYYYADTKGEGSYSQIWDASNNITGGDVPDGKYSAELKATDPTGTVYSYKADVVVDRGPPNIVDHGTTMPIITPNGDGQQDETILKYSVLDVGTQIKTIVVNIYNSPTIFDNSTLVKTLAGDTNGDTVWDGSVNIKGGNGDLDNNGYADKGLYKYVITATDVLANKRTFISSYEVQVDKVHLSFLPPLNNPSEPYFSPNGDGVKDNTDIKFMLVTTQESNPIYLLSKGPKLFGVKLNTADYYVGKVTVKIKDNSGSTIKTLMDNTSCYKDLTYSVTWDGTDNAGTKVNDGSYSIEVSAVDMIGDLATNRIILSGTIDIVAPNVAITSPIEDSWQKGLVAVNGTISDINPVNYLLGYNEASNNISTGEGNKLNENLANWDTSGIGETCTIELSVIDSAGNSASTSKRVNIDNSNPSISNIQVKSNGQIRDHFNPYVDDNVAIEFNVNDNSFDPTKYCIPASNAVLDAELWLNNVKIATIESDHLVASGNNSFIWSGLNIAGDYVNEGQYSVRLKVKDATNLAANATCEVEVRDDIRLTNISPDGFNPNGEATDPFVQFLGNGNISVTFNDGWMREEDRSCACEAHAQGGSHSRDHDNNWFFLNYDNGPVSCTTSVTEQYWGTNIETRTHDLDKVDNYGSGNAVNAIWHAGGGSMPTRYLNKGWHKVHAYLNVPSGGAYAETRAYYKARIYRQYSLTSSNSGKLWGSIIFKGETDSLPNYSYKLQNYGTTETAIGSIKHRVFIRNENGFNNLNYQRSTNNGSTWSIPCKLTHSSNVSWPSITCEANGTAYVAWEDTRDGHKEIYFQKIPNNFAPVKSPGMTTFALPQQGVVFGPISLQASSTLEIISPSGGGVVKTLRPTFKWYGLQNIRDYKIECSTTSDADALNNALDYFTTTISDTSSTKPLCEYMIPDHYMGLDESSSSNPYWYWRVRTINTTEAVTSEVGSFKVELPMSLSGVTNWPNPFNPTKERTKIRYKLGKEADSVSIRIYDITGALVKELDGTCNAEGASAWNKYNDVEWDGRNGVGDVVLNGVYPFEVMVESGGRSVSARGKAVVLK